MWRFLLASLGTLLLAMGTRALVPPFGIAFRDSSERRQSGWILAEVKTLLKKGRMAAAPSRSLRCGRTLHTITWNPCCSLSRPVSACQAVLPTAWSVPTLLFIVRWCRATGWRTPWGLGLLETLTLSPFLFAFWSGFSWCTPSQRCSNSYGFVLKTANFHFHWWQEGRGVLYAFLDDYTNKKFSLIVFIWFW